jgi:hypothetical protein
MMAAWMTMVLMEIDVSASFSQVSFSSSFSGVMVVLVKIYSGGRAPPYQDVNKVIFLMKRGETPRFHCMQPSFS